MATIIKIYCYIITTQITHIYLYQNPTQNLQKYNILFQREGQRYH